MIGKDIRIERIMDRNTGRSVIVPMDHGFSMGQIDGLLDMTKVISDVSDGGANAIILHKGLVKRGHRKHGRDIGLFIHLSGSTSLKPGPERQGPGLHRGRGDRARRRRRLDPHQPRLAERVEDAGDRRECCPGLHPLGHAAPDHDATRGARGSTPSRRSRSGHAVRVAEELGADMIKTNYPGDPEAFRKIVKACSVPVFIAGGEKTGDLESLKIIRDAVGVGGAGVCVGRNAFQREDTTAFVQALCKVVHHNVDPAKALEKNK